MNSFFTTVPLEDKSFPTFSVHHLVPLAIILTLAFLFISKRDQFIKYKGKIRIILALVILSQMVLLYSWYIASGTEMLIYDGLPLYLCRVTNIIIVISFLFNKKNLYYIIFYIVSYGSILGLILPDTSGYLLPHVMYDQYFITHGTMFLSVLFIYFYEGFEVTYSKFKNLILFILSYGVVVSIINKIIGSNYGYLENPPKSNNLFSFIPSPMYKIVAISIMILLSFIVHLVVVFIEKKVKIIKKKKIVIK